MHSAMPKSLTCTYLTVSFQIQRVSKRLLKLINDWPTDIHVALHSHFFLYILSMPKVDVRASASPQPSTPPSPLPPAGPLCLHQTSTSGSVGGSTTEHNICLFSRPEEFKHVDYMLKVGIFAKIYMTFVYSKYCKVFSGP